MATDYYETLGQEDMDIGTEVVSKRNPAGGLLSTTQVNIASFARGQVRSSVAWTPGAIAAGDAATTTITVSGATVGDFVLAGFSEMPASSTLIFSAYVSEANLVTVVIANPTLVASASPAAVTLTAGTLYALVFTSR